MGDVREVAIFNITLGTKIKNDFGENGINLGLQSNVSGNVL